MFQGGRLAISASAGKRSPRRVSTATGRPFSITIRETSLRNSTRPPCARTACTSPSAMAPIPPSRCWTPRCGRSSAEAAYSAFASRLVAWAAISSWPSTNWRSRSEAPFRWAAAGRNASASSAGESRCGQSRPSQPSPCCASAAACPAVCGGQAGDCSARSHIARAVRSCQLQKAAPAAPKAAWCSAWRRSSLQRVTWAPSGRCTSMTRSTGRPAQPGTPAACASRSIGPPG